jgi:hypothetical protein
VRVDLAHQGTCDFLESKLGLSSTIFCRFADICIDLDDVLAADQLIFFDGHWSTSGHATIARPLKGASRLTLLPACITQISSRSILWYG